MTVGEFLHRGTAELSGHGIASARLDCLILLEDVLNKNRTHILAHPEANITSVQQQKLEGKLARRAAHEPLAYIRKHASFYGRILYVDKRVLVPRPETEAMIELLMQLRLAPNVVLVDVGTGSGALAITAKLEIPWAAVIGIDINAGCLRVATRNARQLNATVTLLRGNLLAPAQAILMNRQSILLCNLPYVPITYPINTAAAYEPPLALYAGDDGLELYRNLFAQLMQTHIQPRCILTESMPQQLTALTSIADAAGYRPHQTSGLIQLFVPAT